MNKDIYDPVKRVIEFEKFICHCANQYNLTEEQRKAVVTVYIEPAKRMAAQMVVSSIFHQYIQRFYQLFRPSTRQVSHFHIQTMFSFKRGR